MGGSQKSKRITWASDVNLCQVRLFLSEDSPSKVGIGTQGHLQAKVRVQSGCDGADDNLPPGFEGIQPANLWRVKLSQIPLMKWRCPPKFEVNSQWQVVAGEESKEIEAQNQREMRVLEAIYPRPSAIPPNPSSLKDVEDSIANDKNTPVVPVTPIEDDYAGPDESFGSLTANHNPVISQPHQSSSSQCGPNVNTHANGISTPLAERDIVVAAAQAALTSVLSNSSNSGQGNLIDHDLLIRILSNPKMVELVTSHAASSTAQSGPPSSMKNMASSSYQSMPLTGAQSVASFSTHVPSSSNNHNMPSSSLQSKPAIVPLQKNTPSTQNMPSTSSQHAPSLNLPPKNLFNQLSAQITRPEFNMPSTTTAAGQFYPPQLRTGSIPGSWSSAPDVSSAPSTSVGAPMTKDINYYKSLIQQHGAERRDALPQSTHQSNQAMGTSGEPLNFVKSRESRTRITKPCIYFNSSRGCRNGDNCAFQHDTSSQKRVNGITEIQCAKRVKLDRQIAGT